MLLRRYNRLNFEVGAAAVALLCASLAQAQPASMTQTASGGLITKGLLAAPSKEVVMTTVVYPPGGSSRSIGMMRRCSSMCWRGT